MKTFKHSGNLGDIIYSLPTVISLGGGKLYIGDGTGNLGIGDKFMMPRPMTAQMVSQIIELLKLQPYLSDVQPYKNEAVDFNLDLFRRSPRLFTSDHLANTHLKTFGVKFNLGLPWLRNINSCYINEIVISHNVRREISPYHKFNWQALRKYENRCIFIGFEDEHVRFKELTGLSIKRYPVSSILDFARIIKGSKLFIGNQSLGFALAEGMKHPRVLEVCYTAPNCMPQSINGHIRLSVRLLDKLLNKKDPLYINASFDNFLANIRNHIFLSYVRNTSFFGE